MLSPAALSAARSVWKISDARAQRLGKVWRADRHDHEFLEIDRIVGMHAAVDDVHHRHRQQRAPRCRRHSGRAAALLAAAAALATASETPRMALAPSRALLGVPSSAIIVSSILTCASASMPPIASKISPLTASTALAHALAEIALLVAVAQLDGLVRAGRGARRHGGAAARAVLEDDIDLDGRIAAAVENFAADNIDDGGHTAAYVPIGRSITRAASTGSARLLPRLDVWPGRALVMARQAGHAMRGDASGS